MNERIKELACQTLTRFDQDMDGSMEPEKLGDWIRYDDLEKFAELIVRECAEVAADHDALDIYEEIREHFGVEL